VHGGEHVGCCGATYKETAGEDAMVADPASATDLFEIMRTARSAPSAAIARFVA